MFWCAPSHRDGFAQDRAWAGSGLQLELAASGHPLCLLDIDP
jgi:hypothetical protein